MVLPFVFRGRLAYFNGVGVGGCICYNYYFHVPLVVFVWCVSFLKIEKSITNCSLRQLFDHHSILWQLFHARVVVDVSFLGVCRGFCGNIVAAEGVVGLLFAIWAIPGHCPPPSPHPCAGVRFGWSAFAFYFTSLLIWVNKVCFARIIFILW